MDNSERGSAELIGPYDGCKVLRIIMIDLVDESLTDPAVQQCPFPYYAALRESAPISQTRDGYYIVTSHKAALEVTKNHQIYSSMSPAGGLGPNQCAAAERLVEEKGFGRFMPVLVNNDPPSHSSYRNFAMKSFLPNRVRQMEPYIVETANGLINTFADHPVWDVVHDFGIPMQVYVIAHQLGVPSEDFRLFREWSDAWLIGLGLPVPDEVHMEAAEKVVEMQHYMMAKILERRKEPRDDLLSDLIQTRFPGERPLTDNEVLSMAENFLVAGNETTSNSLGMGLLRLAADHGLQEALRSAPDRIPRFVDELLRMDAPVQMMPRYVTEDTVLGGVELPKGAMVMVAFAAANRDEAKFADPESFSIDRANNSAHLSFGSGIHTCVGSQLAKLVLTIGFRVFLERIGPFTLADQADVPHYAPSFVLRGLTSLRLKLQEDSERPNG